MTFQILTLAFVAAIALHNLEEAIWLPQWSKTAGRWHAPVGAFEFRFAVAALTVLAAVVAGLALRSGKGSVGTYLLCGYALAMLLNVAIPHVLGSIVLQRYMPGTVTALLLNLPVTALLLRSGFAEGQIDKDLFLWAGPVIVVAIAASIPMLFWLGRRILPQC